MHTIAYPLNTRSAWFCPGDWKTEVFHIPAAIPQSQRCSVCSLVAFGAGFDINSLFLQGNALLHHHKIVSRKSRILQSAFTFSRSSDDNSKGCTSGRQRRVGRLS